MKIFVFLALLLFFAPAKAIYCQETGFQVDEQIREYYDKAFERYCAQDYQKAIEYWNMVLKLDPNQVTAKNMIAQARQKLSKSSKNLKTEFYQLIYKGNYEEAVLKIEEMLATDATNPVFLRLQARLKKMSPIVSKALRTNSWKTAVMGLYHYINEIEDLNFAYDALRYSLEREPSEQKIEQLISMLEEENPQLKLNDTKPANMGILEHKKNVALHYIYDSKFHLAVKELESILELEPNDVVSLKRLGSTYLQLKDYKLARATWEQALKISPEDDQLKEYLNAIDKMSPNSSHPSTQPRKKRKIRRG